VELILGMNSPVEIRLVRLFYRFLVFAWQCLHFVSKLTFSLCVSLYRADSTESDLYWFSLKKTDAVDTNGQLKVRHDLMHVESQLFISTGCFEKTLLLQGLYICRDLFILKFATLICDKTNLKPFAKIINFKWLIGTNIVEKLKTFFLT